MRDELAEMKRHLRPGFAAAHAFAVPVAVQREVQAPALPGAAELVGRHRHRAEGRGGLGLQETEALGQLAGDELAQAPVVGQHHQSNRFQRLCRRRTQGHVGGDHRDLGLEVDAPGFIGKGRVLHGAEQVVAATLVHQRVAVEALGHRGAARFAHQLHVVEVRRAVGPLVSAWQGRHALAWVERESVARFAAVERGVQVFKLRRDEVPVVEQSLHARGDAGGEMRAGQVTRDHDQLAVAGAVIQGGEFHGGA